MIWKDPGNYFHRYNLCKVLHLYSAEVLKGLDINETEKAIDYFRRIYHIYDHILKRNFSNSEKFNTMGKKDNIKYLKDSCDTQTAMIKTVSEQFDKCKQEAREKRKTIEDQKEQRRRLFE
jgi:hypothetical protein